MRRRSGPKRRRSDLRRLLRTVRWVRPADLFALALAAGAIAVAFYVANRDSGGEAVAIIETADTTYIYPLAEERDVVAEGPIGQTVIEIRQGQIRVVDSPGPRKICVRAGWISTEGQWLACLPNRIFIRVRGGQAAEIDAQAF